MSEHGNAELTTAQDLLEKTEKIISKINMPDRHSFFQMEKFMIGREPTAHSQIWQIVREMQVRAETVDNYLQQLEDAEDDLEMFDINIERCNRKLRDETSAQTKMSDLNIQEYEINIRKLQRQKQSLVNSARKVRNKLRFVLEELAFLVGSYEQIVAHIGEPRPFDDRECQKEMWNEKLLEEYNLRVLLHRPLDPDFVRTVLCLGDDSPVKRHVVNLLENIQQKMLASSAVKSHIEGK